MFNPWRDWPHRWFGYSCWDESQDDHFPALRRLIDPSWHPDDLADILVYLRETPVCWCAQPNYCPCNCCGEPLPESATALWDGEWLWPHTLAHYAERHHLRLPDAMVARIRALGYRPRELTEVEIAREGWVTAQLVDLLNARRPVGPET